MQDSGLYARHDINSVYESWHAISACRDGEGFQDSKQESPSFSESWNLGFQVLKLHASMCSQISIRNFQSREINFDYDNVHITCCERRASGRVLRSGPLLAHHVTGRCWDGYLIYTLYMYSSVRKTEEEGERERERDRELTFCSSGHPAG